MTTANVQVTRISNKTVTTKYGPKPTFSFQSDGGEWFSLGFKKPTFVVGDSVSFEFDTTTYGNQVQDGSLSITTAKKGLSTMPASTSRAPTPPAAISGYRDRVFPVPPLSGERAIIRQNALTNAREVYVGAFGGKPFTVHPGETAEAIINLARLFENYTTGDADTAMAEAMITKEKVDKALEEMGAGY